VPQITQKLPNKSQQSGVSRSQNLQNMMKIGDNFLYEDSTVQWKNTMNINSHWNLKFLFIKLFL